MRPVLWGLILGVLLVSALVAINRHDPDPTEPITVVHVIDPRGDIEWSPPPTTTTTTTSTTSTTAPPPTTPRARTAPRPVGEIADIIRRGFARFGPAVAEEAVRVAGCESTGDPSGQRLDEHAVNGQHLGVLQLSRKYHEARARRLGFRWEQMAEAGPNVAVAADLYSESKWSPWTCRWAA